MYIAFVMLTLGLGVVYLNTSILHNALSAVYNAGIITTLVLFVPIVILWNKTKFKERFEEGASNFNWKLALTFGIISVAMIATGELMSTNILCYIGITFTVAMTVYLAKYMVVNGVIRR